MIRLLTRADAPAVKQLFLDTVASGVWTGYPGGVNTTWTLEKAREAVRDSLALGYFKPDDTLRGFFLIRQASPRYVQGMPEDYSARTDARQLWLAGVTPGVSAAQVKTALDALSKDGWFVHLAGHLAWVEAPRAAMSTRTRQYLDTNFAHYEYDNKGHTISIWVHEA